MRDSSSQSIKEVTRLAIFTAMSREHFQWWGQSSEADLLGRVFDLKSMESNDQRQPNAADDIRMHRDLHPNWSDDWIFTDPLLNLIKCPDATLLKLFETMVHPTIQPDPTAC